MDALMPSPRPIYMTTEEFRAGGRAAFGPRWKAALARALGISERQVHYYAAGDRIPGPVALAVRGFASVPKSYRGRKKGPKGPT